MVCHSVSWIKNYKNHLRILKENFDIPPKMSAFFAFLIQWNCSVPRGKISTLDSVCTLFLPVFFFFSFMFFYFLMLIFWYFFDIFFSVKSCFTLFSFSPSVPTCSFINFQIKLCCQDTNFTVTQIIWDNIINRYSHPVCIQHYFTLTRPLYFMRKKNKTKNILNVCTELKENLFFWFFFYWLFIAV